MKHFCRNPLLLLVVLVFSSAAPAHSLTPTEVKSFLQNNYPFLDGTIVFQDNNNYFAEVNTNLREAEVEIFRQSVASREGTRRLVKKVIGVSTVSVSSGESVKLDLPEALKRKVNLGDRLRLPDRPLLVRNRSRVDTDTLVNAAKSVQSVKTVVAAKPDADFEGYVLDVSEKRLRLASTGPDHKQLAVRNVKAVTKPTDQNEVLETIHKFERSVRDVESVEFTGRRNVTLLALASKHEVGFARYDTDLTRVSWESVRGEILDVSTGKPSSETYEFPLTLVLKQDKTVRTRFYTYDPVNRTLKSHWTISNSWIHGTESGFFRQEIGLNSPFEYGVRRIKLNEKGVQNRKTSETFTQRYVYSPSYNIHGGVLVSLDESGRIELFEDNEKLASTSQRYGGSSLRITAQRGESSVTLNPEFDSWGTGTKTGINILVPENNASGITFVPGLTSYTSSRLYFLKFRNGTLKSTWESKRLPGYTSSVLRLSSHSLISVVNSEDSTTKLFRIRTKAVN